MSAQMLGGHRGVGLPEQRNFVGIDQLDVLLTAPTAVGWSTVLRESFRCVPPPSEVAQTCRDAVLVTSFHSAAGPEPGEPQSSGLERHGGPETHQQLHTTCAWQIFCVPSGNSSFVKRDSLTRGLALNRQTGCPSKERMARCC
jgi:hypothetical protein